MNTTLIKELFKGGVPNTPLGRRPRANEAAHPAVIENEEEPLYNSEPAKEVMRSGEIHSGITGEMAVIAKIGMVKVGEWRLRKNVCRWW